MKEQENPMLTWDAAVQAIKDEGHSPYLIFQTGEFRGYVSNSRGSESLAWGYKDPVEAINALLLMARERWPAKHPWDDLGLDELIEECAKRAWSVELTPVALGTKWAARINCFGNPIPRDGAPENALRAAMKAREAAGR